MEDPWILLNDAIDRVILARHGEAAHGWLGHPWIIMDSNVPHDEHLFIHLNTKPYDSALTELRRLLAEGRMTAFEELAEADSLEPQHRQIAPIEWSTLVFKPRFDLSDCPKRRIRLRRADLEKHWPLTRSAASELRKISRSPFQKDRALEIFHQNDGWMHLNQGQAAAQLRATYSRDISNMHVPSPETVEAWVREWTPKGDRPKGKV